jgi:hypothetical protein
MGTEDPRVEKSLEGLDQSKRDTLNRLVTGSAFVAPIVAGFAMQGISVRPAHAQGGSSSNISDRRLKKQVVRLETDPRGFGIYRFSYVWSDKAYVGVIAQDVMEHVPSAVTTGPGGFLAVDYGAIGMAMTPAA